ncbi:Flagella basal body P-ring formation protein FlgA [Buchnera aphidicola (Protaphis terricola)]|uniref:flagellar basal body P-ring formation chaperone FlgA n=1 Tax=Buchnera aphidicola TaxID=9 RepID=UPI0034642038
MKLIKIFFISLLFFSFNIYADDLINRLNKLFKEEYTLNINNFEIILRTPLIKNKTCKNPNFLLPGNFNHFGLFDILYICGEQHQHLKVELQMKGEYIVACKKIPRGTKISDSDLKVITGRLDNLPNGTYLHKKDVINKVNIRDILPFQPITSFMTHVFWLVKANDQVTVKIKGKNFEIITFGKALSNGGAQENIRVQIKSGKIITGKINKNREVIMER